jgi:hypothetical protein
MQTLKKSYERRENMSKYEEAWIKKKIHILQQVDPNPYAPTDYDLVIWLLNETLEALGLEMAIHFYDAEIGDYNTIAYCERAYDLGYDAIINDGQLIAFKKAV